ncbi:MAG: UPF0280 family protein [Pseudomonadota bacterium]
MLSFLDSRLLAQSGELSSVDYRGLLARSELIQFSVRVKQSDLLISARSDLAKEARELLLHFRGQLEEHIEKNPSFLTSFSPVSVDPDAASIVKRMARAGLDAGVGPMASVAGAIAEAVGKRLLQRSSDVIVENGGDIFCSMSRQTNFLLLAEKSDFGALNFVIETKHRSFGVCTSAGSTGPSFSFGTADGVMVAAKNAAFADAAATAIGNVVQTAGDVEKAIDLARSFNVIAAIVVKSDRLAAFGDVVLEPAYV